MFNNSLLHEKRPLKKPCIGPPILCPQEFEQEKDELTSDVFESARNCNVTASKVEAYFNAIISQKEELSMLLDAGRKRQQINILTKNHMEAWFKDLTSNKPLNNLSKKVPKFNKKEEIFMMLTEYQVPMTRAAWFIKLSFDYTVAISETQNKEQQVSDRTTEFTGTLLKFVQDQIPILLESYSQAEKPNLANTSLTTVHTNGTEQKLAVRYWEYCTRLLKYMYEEGLMDHQEVLNWIIELLEKQKSDEGILQLLLPLTLQYVDEFVHSELLCRRLAHLCVEKLSFMLNNVAEANLITSPNSLQTPADDKKMVLPNPMQNTLILQLRTLIQTIRLECPVALVRCETDVELQALQDNLPIIPSIPIPKQIMEAENNIREKSKKEAVEKMGDTDPLDILYLKAVKSTTVVNSIKDEQAVLQKKQRKKRTYTDCDENIDIHFSPKRKAVSVSSNCSRGSNASRFRERRERNNKASQKSRMKRKVKEDELEKEADDLHYKNIKLRAQLEELEKMVTHFKDNLFKIVAKK